MAINHLHPISHLNEHVKRTIYSKPFCGRLWQTITMIKDQKGFLATTATASCITLGIVYTFAFSYFCAEGAILSLIEAEETYKVEGHLSQSIGDAGGWLALPVFSIIGLTTTLRQFAREGEFAKVQEIFQEWHQTFTSRKVAGDRAPIPTDELYTNFNNILGEVASQCIFYKSFTNRILISLEIMKKLDLIDVESPINPATQLSLDIQLKPIYLQIETEKKSKLSGWNYFHRLRAGLIMTEAMHGIKSRNLSIITGIACPLILAFGAVCSAIGEPILGEKIFIKKEDVVEVGHFGEWPDNLVGAVVVSSMLNRDLIRKGDAHILCGIYQRHLDALDPTKNQTGNRDLYNQLCTVANGEIQQIMSSSFFSSLLNFNVFQTI